jgi:serine/threonine-protein kinase
LPPTEDDTPAVEHTGSIEVYLDPMPERIATAFDRPDRVQTSPAVYRLRMPDGSVQGPMSYPRIVELLTAGEIDADTEVSVAGAAFRALRDLAELTRFVTSVGLAWDTHDLENVAARGDLSKVSIPRLFYRLASMSETGVLHLRQGARRKKVYFVRGQPEFVGSTDKAELLGEWLVRRRICLRMEVDMALAMLPRFGGHLGDALVGLGILRPIELFRAIAAQVKDRLLEIFRWRSGEFVYAIGMQSHEETFPLGVDTYEIIGEGVAAGYRAEELEGLLAPFQEKVLRLVPLPRVPLERFALPDGHARILRSIDGRRTLAGILARESLAGTADPEEVYQTIYLGLSCEMIEA